MSQPQLAMPLRAEPVKLTLPSGAAHVLNTKNEVVCLCPDLETAALIVGRLNQCEQMREALQQCLRVMNDPQLATNMQLLFHEWSDATAKVKAALAAGGEKM